MASSRAPRGRPHGYLHFEDARVLHYGAGAWRRVRLAALQRDRFRCIRCGALAVEVDHVLPREVGGLDDVVNLRSLCADCHAARHGSPPLPR